MENNTHLGQRAFKEGFLAKLASVGMTRRDIPTLLAAHALVKKASMWDIGGEMIEGAARIVPEVLSALTYKIPYSVMGAAALGGGTLALVTSQEDARKQRIMDEESRIRRLIQQTERGNIARGIAPPTHMPSEPSLLS